MVWRYDRIELAAKRANESMAAAARVHIAERGRPVTRQNIDNGWVIANRLSRVPLREGLRESIALDARGKAVTTAESIVSRARGTNKVQGGSVHLN